MSTELGFIPFQDKELMYGEGGLKRNLIKWKLVLTSPKL
jgi:hypothetical protein